ncbi:hypothetical protein FKW77_008130 [Venturia effusa]|uniref:BTB domain-containing protein n=1 Tax=Venturia effusa TaxID=50376 RepID=A0A517LG04_9PEZI|nr:hypothetical protein FKW77_008130 [Venturia effusa]
MTPANGSVYDAQAVAFNRSVTIRVNQSKNVEDPSPYVAHPALLIKTSGYLEAKLAQTNTSPISPLRSLRPGTFRTYLRWIYSGKVAYEDLLMIDFAAAQALDAPAFQNAIMDTLYTSVKKGLSLFPAKGKLCPSKTEHAEVGMRRLMIDLMVWEFDNHTRDNELSSCNVQFQRDVWKQCSFQKPSSDQSAPYASALGSYYEIVGSRTPLFTTARSNEDARDEDLQFEEMVTYLIGPEEQRFHVHPGILRASSERLNPPVPPENGKVPNGDPDIFQAFLEWLYFQIVPPKMMGFEHLLNCYHFAELFEVVSFANAVMMTIIALFNDRMPILDEIHMAYDKLQQGSPLRRLLIDIMVWDTGRYYESVDGPFPVEYINSVMKIRETINEDKKRECGARPWLVTPELYMLQQDWKSSNVSDTIPSSESSHLLRGVNNTSGNHLDAPQLPRPVMYLPTTRRPALLPGQSSSTPSLQPRNDETFLTQTNANLYKNLMALFPPLPSEQTMKRGLFVNNVPALEIKKFFGSSATHVATCYWLKDNYQRTTRPTFLVTFYDRAKANEAFNALPSIFKEKESSRPNQKKTRPYVCWAVPLPKFEYKNSRVMTLAA